MAWIISLVVKQSKLEIRRLRMNDILITGNQSKNHCSDRSTEEKKILKIWSQYDLAISILLGIR